MKELKERRGDEASSGGLVWAAKGGFRASAYWPANGHGQQHQSSILCLQLYIDSPQPGEATSNHERYLEDVFVNGYYVCSNAAIIITL